MSQRNSNLTEDEKIGNECDSKILIALSINTEAKRLSKDKNLARMNFGIEILLL